MNKEANVYNYVVRCCKLDLFKVLFNIWFEWREIYNVANENSIASIAEVASICAEITWERRLFSTCTIKLKKGFSQSKDCILDNSKLNL